MTCNTFNSPTSKFSDYAADPAVLQAQIVTFPQMIRAEQDPAAKYDTNQLIDVSFNMVNWVKGYANEDDWPYAWDRVERGPILPTEFADFLDSSGYNIDDVDNLVTNQVSPIQPDAFMDQLEYFYDENFANSITGGFCSSFANALNTILGIINGASDFIKSLASLASGLAGQLQSLGQLLQQLVDTMAGVMLQQLQNIISSVSAIVGGAVAMGNLLYAKAQKAAQFFSEANLKGIKAAIDKLISDMSKAYENLTPELIAYLLYRLCQLAEAIANFMQSPVQGIMDLLNTFQSTQTALKNISYAASARAIQAGGFRMDEFDVARIKSQSAEAINASSYTNSVDRSYYVTKGFTDVDIARATSLTEPGNQFVEFGPGVLKIDTPFEGAGYKKVNPEIWMRIFRVAERLGKKLTINSAYRDPAYNASLESKGAAKNSLHMSGEAIDVSMNNIGGPDQIAEFIKIASQEGFGAVVYYPSQNFVHCDSGDRRRSWNKGQSHPTIERALDIHIVDGFRNGTPPLTTSNVQ